MAYDEGAGSETMKKKPEKHLTKQEKKQLRREKALQWLFEEGNLAKPHVLSRYRKHMRLDLQTAEKDLRELGILFDPDDEDAKERSESLKKQAEFESRYREIIETSDDWFSYIAGETDGGFAFGVTWEEVGIDSSLPYEEKVRLYAEQMDALIHHSPEADDLPF
jgi:hypothetical protein